MTYTEWFYQHGEKHKAIMAKLSHLNTDEIIRYFRFENMVEKEPDFCLLYKENKKCHDVTELNCYLCACPHFRFNEKGYDEKEGKILYSTCSISSKEGGEFISKDAIHQDCTKCLIPHSESYIAKNFDRDWFSIMEDVC
jgi:hypothetical protein